MKYHEWYIQSIGGLLGLIVCIYSYLQGNIITFSNISSFENISFLTTFTSYTIYPLCLLLLILTTLNFLLKDKLSNRFEYIYNVICFITIIIGIIGCHILFIIPSLLILYVPIEKSIYKLKERKGNREDTKESLLIDNSQSKGKVSSNENNSIKRENLQKTKKSMAESLLKNNADMDFIAEVTGLDENEINNLKNIN